MCKKLIKYWQKHPLFYHNGCISDKYVYGTKNCKLRQTFFELNVKNNQFCWNAISTGTTYCKKLSQSSYYNNIIINWRTSHWHYSKHDHNKLYKMHKCAKRDIGWSHPNKVPCQRRWSFVRVKINYHHLCVLFSFVQCS